MSAEQQTRPVGHRPRPKVSIYLESAYQKLVRGLPQTIFYCPECKGHRRRRQGCARCGGRGKLTDESVQELIGRQALPAFRARDGKFHGAGREDIDVRMLGDGRPFVFEVVGARALEVDLEELRRRIHERDGDRIQLAPFVRVPRARVAYWKESRFDKVYRAEVELGAAVDPTAAQELIGQALDISQRTPQRVAHRRADLDRERRVEIVGVAVLDSGALQIDVRCAHGTYVKEWISGDGGRTRPALADLLGVACDCRQLDVLKIVLEGADSD